MDKEGTHRNIYIDVWADNKDCSKEDKENCPNDADLCLVSSGDNTVSFHAPFMIAAGKRPERKIICSSEVGLFISSIRPIAPTFYGKMQPGGTKDFGFAKISMVHAEATSVCQRPDGRLTTGGMGVGYVINIPDHNLTIYHSGITNVFRDMQLIDDLHKPNIAIIPIGDDRGMSPRVAAYATKNFLKTPTTIIPMYFSTLPGFKNGTVENYQKECEAIGVEGKTILNPKDLLSGKAIIE